MAQIRYLAPSPGYKRILRDVDLVRLGVNHPDTIVFEKSNKWTLEMTDEACEMLVRKLPGEFVVLGSPIVKQEVTEETGSSESDESPDELDAVAPQESPDDSLSDEAVTTTKSPRAYRPRG